MHVSFFFVLGFLSSIGNFQKIKSYLNILFILFDGNES